jgi:hypothetical protein
VASTSAGDHSSAPAGIGAAQPIQGSPNPELRATLLAAQRLPLVVSAGPASTNHHPTGPNGGPLGPQDPYTQRFLDLYNAIHDPANGYFSPGGVPYHSIETLLAEAPDYGHETTSEAFSYWIWLESMYGKVTGDWGPLNRAWATMEQTIIPTHNDQPTNSFYNPGSPATYAPEYEDPSQYPARLDFGVRVGQDPLANALTNTYHTSDIYGMHWLLDVDNWYGYGNHGDGTSTNSYINTYQRGAGESVWATVPQPSWETFRWGGRNGYLDLFTGDNSYSPQWRYTDAPDADARTIQAIYWAYQWANAQGQADQVPTANAAKMGDYLRYSFFDKYFKQLGAVNGPNSPAGTGARDPVTGYDDAHMLLSWYYAWGGALPGANWAWRIGSSSSHFGYQNPMAAYALSSIPALEPGSVNSPADWQISLSRQLELYRWLQSADGAIAGGVTNSWNGRYDTPPQGATFYRMAYDFQPVYHDPPSNSWFGWQAWSMERLAEYYSQTGDPHARMILDPWVSWVENNTWLGDNGSYAIPSNLDWSGRPTYVWDSTHQDWVTQTLAPDLHVSVQSYTNDVGVTASLAQALAFYSAGTRTWGDQDVTSQQLSQALLDGMWSLYRDDQGVAAPEARTDYHRFFDQVVYIPPGWTGHMPNGDLIHSGNTFLDIRSRYRSDPAFSTLQDDYNQGITPVFTYHRFWAQSEIALANATYGWLFS